MDEFCKPSSCSRGDPYRVNEHVFILACMPQPFSIRAWCSDMCHRDISKSKSIQALLDQWDKSFDSHEWVCWQSQFSEMGERNTSDPKKSIAQTTGENLFVAMWIELHFILTLFFKEQKTHLFSSLYTRTNCQTLRLGVNISFGLLKGIWQSNLRKCNL